MNEILESLLVARLLALAERAVHVGCREGKGRRVGSRAQAKARQAFCDSDSSDWMFFWSFVAERKGMTTARGGRNGWASRGMYALSNQKLGIRGRCMGELGPDIKNRGRSEDRRSGTRFGLVRDM